MSRFESSASERRSTPLLERSFRKSFPRAARGEGAYLWDTEGKRYLDFSGSAAVNFVGHGVKQIIDAIAEQASAIEFVHSSQFVTRVAEEFAGELLDFAGPGFRDGAVYFTSGGSEAIETALKLARQYQVETGHPQRYRIISRSQSYHGSTLGALAVSGNRKRREIYLPMVQDFPHIDTPYCYRCAYRCERCGLKYASQLETAIADSAGSAAAFIFEPVSGATLGAALPPAEYLDRISEICSRHGIVAIADEVMTGCGRTGRNFAFEHWGITPDILVLAKGLSSGYLPLGAVIAGKKIVDALREGTGSFIHGFTYNAHPVSVAAGRAVIERIKRTHLVEAADSGLPGSVAQVLAAELNKLRDLNVTGDVRGIGLLRGVEFVLDRESKQPFAAEQNFSAKVAEACARRGLLVYPMQGCVDGYAGDHLLVAPPAVITPDEVVGAVEQLRQAVEETMAAIG